MKKQNERTPYALRFVYVNDKDEPTIYYGVVQFGYTLAAWFVRFADGRTAYVRFDLVKRVESFQDNSNA